MAAAKQPSTFHRLPIPARFCWRSSASPIGRVGSSSRSRRRKRSWSNSGARMSGPRPREALVEARARLRHELEHGAVELQHAAIAAAQEEPQRAGGAGGALVAGQHAPGAAHAQVRVDGQVALEAQEEVLAVGVHGGHGAAGEPLGPAVAPEARVRRGQLVRHVAGQHRADAVRRVVDGVALGHLSASEGTAAAPRPGLCEPAGQGVAASSRSTRRRTRGNVRGCRRLATSRGRVAERLLGHPELGGGQAGEVELAVVGVPRAGVGDPPDAQPGAARRREDAPLDPADGGRAQPHRAAAADLVERERPAQVARAALGAHVPDERRGAQVVGLPGEEALLGAGGHQPRVAAAARRPAGAGASATSVPTPEALSCAPGDGGTVSAWAMRITRQSRGPASAPITLRERPRPGTAKRSRRRRGRPRRRRPPRGRARGARRPTRPGAGRRARASGRSGTAASPGGSSPACGLASAGAPRGRGRRGRWRRAPRKPTAAS